MLVRTTLFDIVTILAINFIPLIMRQIVGAAGGRYVLVQTSGRLGLAWTNGGTKYFIGSPKDTALRSHIDQNLFPLEQLGSAQQNDSSTARLRYTLRSCKPQQHRQRNFGPSDQLQQLR